MIMDSTQLEETVREFEGRVEDQVKHVSRRLKDASGRVADLVREHPVGTLVGAFAVGYLIAQIARRS
jgi:hypothetical protein